jgi:diacylglycerol kinase family enzyme
MTVSTQIILDPTAYHHRTGRVWQAYQRDLLRELAPAEVTVVEDAAQAEQAVRDSALRGFGKFVCVGDSAAAHGAVNGLMGLADSHRRSVALGFLSIIRQQDWSRTIDFPRGMGRQVEVLRAGHTLPFDVGRVDYFAPQGTPETRYFLNGAGFGLGPRIRHELRAHRKEAKQALAGVARAVGDLFLNRSPMVKLEGDEGLLYKGPCPLGLVMGGRFYPTLGEVAPEASPIDGALDAVWLAAPSLWRMLVPLSRLVLRRKGGTAPERARARSIQASSLDGPIYLEADGQALGRLPATFSIEPRALSFIVPQVGARLKKAAFAPLPDLRNGNLAGNLRNRLGG